MTTNQPETAGMTCKEMTEAEFSSVATTDEQKAAVQGLVESYWDAGCSLGEAWGHVWKLIAKAKP